MSSGTGPMIEGVVIREIPEDARLTTFFLPAPRGSVFGAVSAADVMVVGLVPGPAGLELPFASWLGRVAKFPDRTWNAACVFYEAPKLNTDDRREGFKRRGDAVNWLRQRAMELHTAALAAEMMPTVNE